MARYRFDDIAYNITDKRMPTPDDKELYIGLEHLDTRCLRVSRWGSAVDITGQKLVMRKGDLLFGRRNTYLRRAAIAPHDGLFSAHGMIFRPKTDVITEEFFPYFIVSNYFMDAAIRISVGSLSPTVNWKQLKELEFDIPDIDKQHKYAELFAAVDRTKESYFMSQEGRNQIKSKAVSTSGLYTLSVSKIGDLRLPLPEIESQATFCDFVVHADKSKFEAQQALESLDVLYQNMEKQCFC